MLLIVVPAVFGATVATIVMGGALAPTARLPPVRLHVTVVVPVQAQFVPVALTNVVPAGNVSTTLTADASSGPAFETPIV